MAKVTIVFGVLLIDSWVWSAISAPAAASHRAHSHVVRACPGLLWISGNQPHESRRKLFMHINVTIGLLGFLEQPVDDAQLRSHRSLGLGRRLRSRWPQSYTWPACCSSTSILCVRSFIARPPREDPPPQKGQRMGTMRGGGLGMGMRAERIAGPAAVRAPAQAGPSRRKKKPSLKKVWPQIGALVAPRMGFCSCGPRAHGHQPRRRPGDAVYLEAAARQGAFPDASAP